jgi:hypothetical protein
MGTGTSTDCALSGAGDAAAFTGKCSNADNVVMCQEGKPGDTLYWILKDGGEGGNPDSLTVETAVPFTFTVNGCDNTVTCSSHDRFCANNSNQAKFERTWAFTIPDGSGDCANPCDATTSPIGPTTPTSPTGPTTPTDDTSGPSGSNGDPHFKTWNGEHFEYHGQCDLVLAKDAQFSEGLGLDVQIRTKLVRYWSYIKRAAIRIGEDILEVEGSADLSESKPLFWFNFEYQKETSTVGGFPLEVKVGKVNSRKHHFTIDLSSKYPGVKIAIMTFKEFIKVEFIGATKEAFGNAVGMMGEFETGKTLGRDGSTVIEDFNELGNEWQVGASDTMLFHDTSDPQFPKRCVLPEDPQGQRRRRLEETSVSIEQAEKACASLTDELDRKDCVYDIIATQDVDMVGAF